MLIAALHVEAIRNAVKAKPDGKITGDDVKEGFEKISNFTLGGLVPPLKITATDHEGGGLVQIWQVKGGKFVKATEWFAAYPDVLAKHIKERREEVAAGRRAGAPTAVQRAAADDRGIREESQRTGGRLAAPAALAGRTADFYRARHADSQQHRGHLRRRHPRAQGGVAGGARRAGITTLLGANGAGKTTTLKAISGLLRTERGEVTKGSIELAGQRIDRLPPHEVVRRGVVQVFEGRRVFEHLTTEENLVAGAHIQRDRGA